jgi:peptidoglycan/xylan/chitin deacetylase (PgdA/CDA1 family)
MINLHQVARIATSLIGPLLNRLSRFIRLNNGLTVFLFHEVTDSPSEYLKSTGMWVSKEVFQHQLNWILRNFQVIPITDLLITHKLPRNAAVITFDDAWAGIVKAIEEYLLPRQVPCCFFLNLGTVVDGIDIAAAEKFFSRINLKLEFGVNNLGTILNAWPIPQRQEFLKYQGSIADLDSIQRIGEHSAITISNHSFHHFDAMKLSNREFLVDFQQNNEWIQSLKHTGGKYFYAFPFGTPGVNFEERHMKLLFNRGVKFCFSATSQRLRKFQPSQRLIPRIHFSPDDRTTGNMWWACYKNQILRR